MLEGTVKSRYDALDSERRNLLDRARECASLTLPFLLPPEGATQDDALPTPYQSLAAYGVNNLASKLLLTLFPPNTPFFKYNVDRDVSQEIKQIVQRPDVVELLEQKLAQREQDIQKQIEAQAYRVPMFQALRHLVICGNCLVVIDPKTRGMKVYRLDQYVVNRDPRGDVLEIVLRERVSYMALDEDIQALIEDRRTSMEDTDKKDDKKHLELYTYVWREGKLFKVKQEISGVEVPGSEGSYPLDKVPYLPLRWTSIEGEDYGRGHVEEFLGDVTSLEGLWKSIIESAGAAAKTLFLVNPNSIADVDELTSAPNCSFVLGMETDITTLAIDRYNELKVPFQATQELTERLSRAFLLNSSVQRDAERVTAMEIRYLAAELEDALGGIYSVLSQELQRPILSRIIADMEKAGKLESLDEEGISLTITTGLEALGRGHDLAKIRAFMQDVLEAIPAELVFAEIKPRSFLMRTATAYGVDIDGLFKTEEEKAAEAKAAQEQALIQQFGPEAAQIGGQAILQKARGETELRKEQMKNE